MYCSDSLYRSIILTSIFCIRNICFFKASSTLYIIFLLITLSFLMYTLARELVEVFETFVTSTFSIYTLISSGSFNVLKTSKNLYIISLPSYACQLSSSSFSTDNSLSSSNFLIISPCFIRTPQPSPPAIPRSASLASPGPLTTQPITASFMSRS